MSMDPEEEIRKILAEYELGEIIDFERNERGYVNTSFAIQTRQDGETRHLFLRKYKQGIREAEIRFEHSLIQHLVRVGNLPVAAVLPTRQGKTYLHLKGNSHDQTGVFYSISAFLPGEDKYTWDNPHCTPSETASAAVTFARFHQAVASFRPDGRREEARILELLPQAAGRVAECAARPGSDPYAVLLRESSGLILDAFQSTRAALNRAAAGGLPEMVIHCDYHPGNLKFQNGEVSGLFDFDWSKIDYRLFDLGLAAWYFFASWEAGQDGVFQVEPFRRFLGDYQGSLGGQPGAGKLTAAERTHLPAMIEAGNLYVLYWGLLDMCKKRVDPLEYRRYLAHCVNFIQWYENRSNQHGLAEAIAEC